jgi:hypothetical protein
MFQITLLDLNEHYTLIYVTIIFAIINFVFENNKEEKD